MTIRYNGLNFGQIMMNNFKKNPPQYIKLYHQQLKQKHQNNLQHTAMMPTLQHDQSTNQATDSEDQGQQNQNLNQEEELKLNYEDFKKSREKVLQLIQATQNQTKQNKNIDNSTTKEIHQSLFLKHFIVEKIAENKLLHQVFEKNIYEVQHQQNVQSINNQNNKQKNSNQTLQKKIEVTQQQNIKLIENQQIQSRKKQEEYSFLIQTVNQINQICQKSRHLTQNQKYDKQRQNNQLLQQKRTQFSDNISQEITQKDEKIQSQNQKYNNCTDKDQDNYSQFRKQNENKLIQQQYNLHEEIERQQNQRIQFLIHDHLEESESEGSNFKSNESKQQCELSIFKKFLQTNQQIKQQFKQFQQINNSNQFQFQNRKQQIFLEDEEKLIEQGRQIQQIQQLQNLLQNLHIYEGVSYEQYLYQNEINKFLNMKFEHEYNEGQFTTEEQDHASCSNYLERVEIGKLIQQATTNYTLQFQKMGRELQEQEKIRRKNMRYCSENQEGKKLSIQIQKTIRAMYKAQDLRKLGRIIKDRQQLVAKKIPKIIQNYENKIQKKLELVSDHKMYLLYKHRHRCHYRNGQLIPIQLQRSKQQSLTESEQYNSEGEFMNFEDLSQKILLLEEVVEYLAQQNEENIEQQLSECLAELLYYERCIELINQQCDKIIMHKQHQQMQTNNLLITNSSKRNRNNLQIFKFETFGSESQIKNCIDQLSNCIEEISEELEKELKCKQNNSKEILFCGNNENNICIDQQNLENSIQF